ncbi:hypothetical protein [Sphingomonas sp.]|uniref:hypothetical protein n=1 Tax=Sphingomonas sp. TaxID=28214 RepID=UPI000DB23693|nr:hypothetical protein [Sphingomonas sp.]PZU05997.1 MAG: hypothetical protein DI605_20520 [Sphingomonas sp.]
MKTRIAAVRPDFAGAIAKVAHANRHIAAFAQEAGRYFAKRPYQVVQTPHTDTGEPGYYLYERLGFPDRRLALFIGDALHNLRSALDHLACACAIAQGESPDHTQFPILLKETGLEQKLRKDLVKAGPVAIDLVGALAPTPLGNPMLAALHELDIIDKHRLILPVACTMDVAIQVGVFEGLPVVTARGGTAPPERTSCFVPAPKGYEACIAHDFSFTGDVVFPAGTPLAGQPCVETLYELSAVVADIVIAFEQGFNTVRLSHGISRAGRTTRAI